MDTTNVISLLGQPSLWETKQLTCDSHAILPPRIPEETLLIDHSNPPRNRSRMWSQNASQHITLTMSHTHMIHTHMIEVSIQIENWTIVDSSSGWNILTILSRCYRWNVCSSSKFICWTLITNVMTSGWGLCEAIRSWRRALMDGISDLIKEAPEEFPQPFEHIRTQQTRRPILTRHQIW